METYTKTEVSKHHNVHDLWVCIRGKVYDVTSYVDDHPGGVEVLKDVAGSDGTESFEYVGHSEDAYTALAKFQVGVLEGDTGLDGIDGLAQAWDLDRNQVKRMESRSNGFNRSMIVTFLLAVGFLGRWLIQDRDGQEGSLPRTTSISPDFQIMNGFWLGVILAASASTSGYLYLYAKFTKTLEYYGEVWEYPSYFSYRANRANI